MSTNTPVTDKNSEVSIFRQQLLVARNEVHNLRQQMRALAQSHQNEVDKIKNILSVYQSNECTCSAPCTSSPSHSANSTPSASNSTEEGVFVRHIGVVSTWFPERKAIPRQPGICVSSRGKLVLFNSVFTNPEHALEGLEGFSHMWILFHFHKNDSTHVRAKVSPPRLNGARTGVFGTRSPHRPSPIGLSLVSIDKVEGCCVHFTGVDMMDGTPVLDIKPYIPQYDNPIHCNSPVDGGWPRTPELRQMDGGEPSDPHPSGGGGDEGTEEDLSPTHPLRGVGIGEREAPDGEEGARSSPAATAPAGRPSPPLLPSSQTVRVPAWVDQSPVPKLSVSFGNKALGQLSEIGQDADAVKVAIACVLQEDPRSVYLREKWGNQFYTFLIRNLHVSCKFDDSTHTVFVFQVKSAGKTCECGQPEWQCPIHGETVE